MMPATPLTRKTDSQHLDSTLRITVLPSQTEIRTHPPQARTQKTIKWMGVVWTLIRRHILARRSGGYRGRRNNEPRVHSPRENEKTVMLNLSRLSAFRYDMREIMSHYEINEEAARSVVASVIAKSSRVSINSAMDYVREQEKTGLYPKESLREICDLLDKFSKLR
jgi:uncharacterized protein YneF (UPF0154 family)